MSHSNVTAALASISGNTGIPVSLVDDTLVVAGRQVDLPTKLTGEQQELFGLDGLLPTVPRADDRDKLLWRVIAEARPHDEPAASLLSDRALEQGIQAKLNLQPEAVRTVAAAMKSRFFSSNKKLKVLLPVHAALPLNYAHYGATGKASRYRMFNGGILPFLLWNSRTNEADRVLLSRLLEVTADNDALTELDRKFLEIALEQAPDPQAAPDGPALISRYRESLTRQMTSAGGAFCQPSLDLFRRDLETVLETPLPQPDMIEWVTLLLSLHLTVRLYRIAVVKGSELDLAVAAAAASQLALPPDVTQCACAAGQQPEECLKKCSLAGMLKFRTGSGHFRSVSDRDGCRSSYVEVDQRRLLDMPATLVTTTLACRAWAALGGGTAAEHRDLKALSEALARDEELRQTHGAACAAIAVLHRNAWRKGHATPDELHEAAATNASRPGLHALREEVRRSRSRDLRHQSRDIVNQLMLDVNLAGPGALITRNGTRGFYEIDEQLLLLLVRLICRDRQLPYESFLEELLVYGLAPQDQREQGTLADTLERLGLLVRYSDAGEAAFVHYA